MRRKLTEQSVCSSLKGAHGNDVPIPNGVVSCCKITVDKSDLDRFISDFGLSFSLPGKKQKKIKYFKNYFPHGAIILACLSLMYKKKIAEKLFVPQYYYFKVL